MKILVPCYSLIISWLYPRKFCKCILVDMCKLCKNILALLLWQWNIEDNQNGYLHKNEWFILVVYCCAATVLLKGIFKKHISLWTWEFLVHKINVFLLLEMNKLGLLCHLLDKVSVVLGISLLNSLLCILNTSVLCFIKSVL